MIGPSHDCIVIPARGLAVGKSRLAATLTTSERERLNRQLLEHVLQVALSAFRFPDGCPRPGVGVVVVSPDPATLAFALERGGSPLLEPSALGLNAAIDWAARHVAVMGAARVLVLPADLPLLEVGDVHALLEGDPREVVIAPDVADSGTNGLRFPLDRGFQAAFGNGSCQAHRTVATARGLTWRCLRRPGLARDIDTPDDLSAWRMGSPLLAAQPPALTAQAA